MEGEGIRRAVIRLGIREMSSFSMLESSDFHVVYLAAPSVCEKTIISVGERLRPGGQLSVFGTIIWMSSYEASDNDFSFHT